MSSSSVASDWTHKHAFWATNLNVKINIQLCYPFNMDAPHYAGLFLNKLNSAYIVLSYLFVVYNILFYKWSGFFPYISSFISGSECSNCCTCFRTSRSQTIWPICRLLFWHLDPLILKDDISKILQDSMQRPFLCLYEEFVKRKDWHSILICLVLSPIMFIEVTALLNNWFLMT